MKKTLLITLLFFPVILIAQTPTADELIKVHSVTDESTLNSIASPTEGNLGFNSENQKLYVYSEDSWKQVIFKPKIIKKTSSYTLAPTDDGSIITINSTTDATLTIPSGLPEGFHVSVYQIGSGKITFTGAGATLKNRLFRFKSAGQDSGIGIVSTDTDTFHLTGDLSK